MWHRAKYIVQANSFLGIQGGWEVDLLVVFNSTQKRFVCVHMCAHV